MTHTEDKLLTEVRIKEAEDEIKKIWHSIKDFTDGNHMTKVDSGYKAIKFKRAEINKLKNSL